MAWLLSICKNLVTKTMLCSLKSQQHLQRERKKPDAFGSNLLRGATVQFAGRSRRRDDDAGKRERVSQRAAAGYQLGRVLLEQGELRLGPFQGKAACTRILPGKGVCGTAITQNRTQRVTDVHAFPGHIACDSASNSELVVVLRNAAGEAVGVLDIDSPLLNRFSPEDERAMERAAEIISGKILKKQKGL
jgi:putative methionine-R-sulfoxide reductase with GAF domain